MQLKVYIKKSTYRAQCAFHIIVHERKPSFTKPSENSPLSDSIMTLVSFLRRMTIKFRCLYRALTAKICAQAVFILEEFYSENGRGKLKLNTVQMQKSLV